MKVSSQAMVALALLSTGIGAFVVAGLGAEEDVVEVEDLLTATPPIGERLLVGVPQPREMAVEGPAGVRLQPNPAFPHETVHTFAWMSPDGPRHSVVRVTATQDGTHAAFTATNETRAPGQAQLLVASNATFRVEGLAVPVRAFEDNDGATPVVWTVLPPSDLKEPLRDVPSQLRGRIATVDASGVPLPANVVVFQADSYKAGCSSKFLPDEEKELQAARPA